jgi:hypothetical protein
MSRQCGIVNISQLCRPPRPVTGIFLIIIIIIRQCFVRFIHGFKRFTLWNIRPCKQLKVSQHFGGTVASIFMFTINQLEAGSKLLLFRDCSRRKQSKDPAWWCLVALLFNFVDEGDMSPPSRQMAQFLWTTWHYIPDVGTLHNRN